jgi:DNA-binding IclR family transcriptional regulator
MAVVADDRIGLWSFGPETLGGRSLPSAVAPELELPDVNTGETVRLSSLRGQKVVIASWAPY